MITEIVCYWAFCYVVNGDIKLCSRRQVGTPTQLGISASKMPAEVGSILTAECVGKDEKPSVDWDKKR